MSNSMTTRALTWTGGFILNGDAWNGDASQALLTSVPISLNGISQVCLQLIYTGTPTGTFSFEGSNSYRESSSISPSIPVTWTVIPTSMFTPSVVNPSGAAGDQLIDIPTAAQYLRVKYARTSGSGSLYLAVSGKQ